METGLLVIVSMEVFVQSLLTMYQRKESEESVAANRRNKTLGNVNLKNHFPYEEPREQQVHAIEIGLESLVNDNKRFFILEAGTGVGKSAIGLTLASIIDSQLSKDENSIPGSYTLTTQKILQQQYINDFSKAPHYMLDLKSSSNYTCNFQKKTSCGESLRALKIADKSSPFFRSCMNNCVYKKAKEDFIHGKHGITNFSYFMAETSYAGKLKPRDVLIIDEAHNVENELSKFIEVSISEAFVVKTLKKKMPNIRTQKQAYKWIKNEYLPELKTYFAIIESKIEKLIGGRQRLEQFEKLARQIDVVDKHICKIDRFLQVYSDDNWVFNDIASYGMSSRKFEFKPIDISPFSHDLLFKFGRKVILMSATILDGDAFCDSLGIDKKDAQFVTIPSPFPVENRPVYYFPVGKMNAKEIDSTLPKLTEAVKSILEQHKGEKGIIHCHTFKIANHLKKTIRSKRLLIHDSFNRNEVLRKHIEGSKPTVLLSPSMTEGIDLSDDAGRFQIICKVPYPYLGDKLVKKRMYKWKWWYPLQTTKKIVQSVGRSIRNEKDFAVTYILDQDWDRFYSRNSSLFPETFKEALKE